MKLTKGKKVIKANLGKLRVQHLSAGLWTGQKETNLTLHVHMQYLHVLRMLSHLQAPFTAHFLPAQTHFPFVQIALRDASQFEMPHVPPVCFLQTLQNFSV